MSEVKLSQQDFTFLQQTISSLKKETKTYKDFIQCLKDMIPESDTKSLEDLESFLRL